MDLPHQPVATSETDSGPLLQRPLFANWPVYGLFSDHILSGPQPNTEQTDLPEGLAGAAPGQANPGEMYSATALPLPLSSIGAHAHYSFVSNEGAGQAAQTSSNAVRLSESLSLWTHFKLHPLTTRLSLMSRLPKYI